MEDRQIREIVVQQRESLLRKDAGIEREALKEIEKKIKLPHVIVITGIRRCGKSTLLRQIIKNYYKEDFYYINFEDERFLNFKAEEFNKIYENLVYLFGKKKTFFIDEIQNVDNFQAFVRRFYEDGFKFFITGSSAKLLSKEIGTKLTGRHLDILLTPFSFKEFLKFNKIDLKEEDIYKTEEKTKIKKLFEEYLENGGMPEYLIYKDPEIIKRTYEDIVFKDIISRYRITNQNQLRQLYSYLLSNFGSKFSFHSLKKITDIKSVNTLKKFISFLEESYLAKTITKFDYSYKKQIINDKKIYFIDNGFIKNLSSRITSDKGWLLENLIFVELHKNNEVFYFSEKKECDFILKKDKKIVSAIQVCYDLSDEKTKEREIEGLIEAMNSFNLKEGTIITSEQEEEKTIEGLKIKIIPAWKFLLGV